MRTPKPKRAPMMKTCSEVLNVRMPLELITRVETEARRLGYRNTSHYVRQLLNDATQDAAGRDA